MNEEAILIVVKAYIYKTALRCNWRDKNELLLGWLAQIGSFGNRWVNKWDTESKIDCEKTEFILFYSPLFVVSHKYKHV